MFSRLEVAVRKWLHVVLWLVTIRFCQRFCGQIDLCLASSCILWDRESCYLFVEAFSVGLRCHQVGVRPLFSYYARHHGVLRYFLLLLCGDVSLNPGPVRYPCTVCSKCVRSNQRALQCDMCQLWSHLTCVGVDRDFYAELQEKSEFSWQCPSCLFSVLPSNDIIEADFWLSPSPCDSVPLMDDVLESPFLVYK